MASRFDEIAEMLPEYVRTDEAWPGAEAEAYAALQARGGSVSPAGYAYPDNPATVVRNVQQSQGGLGQLARNLLTDNWLVHMISSGTTLPRDVISGKVPLRTPHGDFNPEVVQRSMDTSGLVAGGSVPAVYGAARNPLRAIMKPELEPVTFNPFEAPRVLEDALPGTAVQAVANSGYRPLQIGGEWFAKASEGPGHVGPFPSQADVLTWIGSNTTAKQPIAPTFYSAVEHAVQNAKIDKATPEQWVNYLRNQPGVKGEELAWLGLGDEPAVPGPAWGKTVTKKEVEDWLNQNRVELKEVTRQGNADGPVEYHHRAYDRAIEYAEEAMGPEFVKEYPQYKDVEYWDLPETVQRQFDDDYETFMNKHQDRFDELQEEYLLENETPMRGDATPRYSDYQLPGGENYRELLFTMPQQQARYKIEPAEWNGNQGFKVVDQSGTMYGGHFRDRAQAEAMLARANQSKNKDTGYTSGHWDEPNVLAHVRMNDRALPKPGFVVQNSNSGNKSSVFNTRAEAEAFQASLPENVRGATRILDSAGNERLLHLEEVQSDWHQAGRKQGYKKPLSEKERGPAIERLHDLEMQLNAMHSRRDTGEYAALDVEARTLRNQITGNEGVPDAPFKSTWADLALKRMLREAAEGNYDAISWTPGEQQAARYDLSKHVKLLSAKKEGDGYLVYLEDLYGQPLFRGRDGWSEHGQKHLTAEQLEAIVGKDVAKKATEGKPNAEGWVDVKDNNLRIGGEGMKSFYDKMLVDKVNALGKKYGAKVEWQEIDTPAKRGVAQGHKVKIPVFRMPQKMRDDILGRGQPLFASGIPFPLEPVDYDPFQEQR